MYEFRAFLRHSGIRKRIYRRIAGLGFSSGHGSAFPYHVSKNVSSTLDVCSIPRADGRLEIDLSISFWFAQVEQILKQTRLPREAFNRLGTVRFKGANWAQGTRPRWVFEGTDKDVEVLDQLASHMRKVVIPFIHEHQHLEKLAEFIDTRNHDDWRFEFGTSHYRLPVIYFLAGRRKDAEKLLEQRLTEMESKGSYGRGAYLDYARWFRDYAKTVELHHGIHEERGHADHDETSDC